MKVTLIFKLLKHVNDFQTIGHGGHFVFQNEAKFFKAHLFVAIDIPANFSEDIFISRYKGLYKHVTKIQTCILLLLCIYTQRNISI